MFAVAQTNIHLYMCTCTYLLSPDAYLTFAETLEGAYNIQTRSYTLIVVYSYDDTCRTGIRAYRDWKLSSKFELLISVLSVSVGGRKCRFT